MAVINKSDLIRILATRFPEIPFEDCDMSVNFLLAYVGNQIGRGNRLEIRNFGTFKGRIRRAGRVRNPKTGETFYKSQSMLPTFKSGTGLQKRVNKVRDAEREI